MSSPLGSPLLGQLGISKMSRVVCILLFFSSLSYALVCCLVFFYLRFYASTTTTLFSLLLSCYWWTYHVNRCDAWQIILFLFQTSGFTMSICDAWRLAQWHGALFANSALSKPHIDLRSSPLSPWTPGLLAHIFVQQKNSPLSDSPQRCNKSGERMNNGRCPLLSRIMHDIHGMSLIYIAI